MFMLVNSHGGWRVVGDHTNQSTFQDIGGFTCFRHRQVAWLVGRRGFLGMSGFKPQYLMFQSVMLNSRVIIDWLSCRWKKLSPMEPGGTKVNVHAGSPSW